MVSGMVRCIARRTAPQRRAQHIPTVHSACTAHTSRLHLAWQVKEEYPEAEVGWKVPELYVPTGHASMRQTLRMPQLAAVDAAAHRSRSPPLVLGRPLVPRGEPAQLAWRRWAAL